MKKTRPVYGVITASAADIEQKEILTGIIEKAQEMNIDTAILSNIYNPNEPSDVLRTENKIYDLIQSEEFDGFVLISESIINTELQQQIIAYLVKKTSVPIVVIGTPLPGFVLPNFRFINNSDENDIEDITNHLIEVHGLTDIDMLTGHYNIEASHKRVEGYRRALEKHGIAFDEKKVYFGDFWLNSGQETAKKYISGELPYPQALICANDYMAYGLLDEFMEQSIPIQEKMSVIGYEYAGERNSHTPLLTTYQRNRTALGAEAVKMLSEKISSGAYGDFTPPAGYLIPGRTCGCGECFDDIRRELKAVQVKQTYDFLNLFSQLEHKLTESCNISEFVQICREFQYMIRDRNALYLCLYENWYESTIDTENMIRYNLIWDEAPVTFHKNNFSVIFSGSAAPYYFCPLFFSDRELGYVVLKFDHPDAYDPIFRNWLKTVSNGLEFLRMKNDIRYLTQCQNLSEQRDTLTGMYNENDLRKAFISAEKEQLYFVGLRICLFRDNFPELNGNEKSMLFLTSPMQFTSSAAITIYVQKSAMIHLYVLSEARSVRNRLLTDLPLSCISTRTIWKNTAWIPLYVSPENVPAALMLSSSVSAMTALKSK